jgi:hypothetical protein
MSLNERQTPTEYGDMEKKREPVSPRRRGDAEKMKSKRLTAEGAKKAENAA